MVQAWSFEKCVAVLSGEIEILRKISSAQVVVRQAVISKEWAEFEEKTAEVNLLGEQFAQLEEDRIQLFFALNCLLGAKHPAAEYSGTEDVDSAEALPFYTLIMRLPSEQSRELSLLYRELKMETLKMKALNESLLTYVNEAKAMAAAYLEAICPARGGKLYTRKGRMVSQDLKSMVFNNQL